MSSALGEAVTTSTGTTNEQPDGAFLLGRAILLLRAQRSSLPGGRGMGVGPGDPFPGDGGIEEQRSGWERLAGDRYGDGRGQRTHPHPPSARKRLARGMMVPSAR